MSANDDIIELVQSHADGDDKKFYAIAMQIAAKAARLGHTQFAQELRDLVTELRRKLITKRSWRRLKRGVSWSPSPQSVIPTFGSTT